MLPGRIVPKLRHAAKRSRANRRAKELRSGSGVCKQQTERLIHMSLYAGYAWGLGEALVVFEAGVVGPGAVDKDLARRERGRRREQGESTVGGRDVSGDAHGGPLF